jgi:arsenical pump membrane protein
VLVDAVVGAWEATWPVLLFLAAITLVSDLCADSRVFDVAAHVLARAARGHEWWLFVLYCALATATTILLGLDTTAVMLTPVALSLARELSLPPLPFAYATLWLANGASLLLPISNLSNLLAVERTGQPAVAFVGELWLPQLAVLTVVLGVLLWRHRRWLHGRYDVPRVLPEHDRTLVVICAVVAAGIAVGTVLGVPAWAAALAGLTVLVLVFARHDAGLVSPLRMVRLLPGGILAGSFGLFVLVQLGLLIVEPDPVEWPHDVTLAATAAVLANVVNNLPAWLALAPLSDAASYPALLVGVNVGGMILLWGSLANLLWRRRCHRAGVRISAGSFAREGLLVVPLAVVLGALAAR